VITLAYRATALKVTNKGANKVYPEWKGTKATGTDYVTFECPGCKKRNRCSMYDAKFTTPDKRIAFACKHCYSVVEVALPISSGVGLIVTPEQYRKEQQKPRGR
jgi:hypothetical protein